MAMFVPDARRPAEYQRFERPTPDWYRDAKLGIFVHWGPYSVPAWAEPIGALGTIEMTEWFRHNPYAEWYYNTIRIEGSPAAEHHATEFGGAPYDDLLDLWTARDFDAHDVMALVARSGARYFVPTTKHHDGVTLWDAPATGTRNTVHRGPRRDLVAEFAEAARARDIRFGVYYSGGLDWHVGQNRPITDDDIPDNRPIDQAYSDYAFDHVADLIERFHPDVLWDDIEWPDAGKAPGPKSLIELFDRFYAAQPEGVVNDRWGETHWDYRTSEYQHGLGVESSEQWENCRGIGYSFGYNRMEDESTSLSGPAAVRHFLDVVSRGGNLLLNIGLTAEGTVPDIQRRTLEELGAFNEAHSDAIFGSRPAATLATASDEPWVRWTRSGDTLHAFIDAPETDGNVTLSVDPAAVDVQRATSPDGVTVIETTEAGIRVSATTSALPGMPVRIDLPLR
jgi:alpha-L-fucosidase